MGELKLTTNKEEYSVEEYFAIANTSEVKMEYLNGQIRSMAGGTYNHSRLSSRVLNQLMNSLAEKECEAFNSDLKVYVDKKNSYVLPDATVICGKPEFSDKDKNAITNPVVVVEVTSKSTMEYDFSEKFQLYRSLTSLKEYIIVFQEQKRVEVYTRREGVDIFQVKSYTIEDEFLYLESLDIQISMVELYVDIVD